MAIQIQVRRDTAANWTTANPALAAGEFGYETNTGKFKIGDGTTLWAALAYCDVSGAVLEADFNANTILAATVDDTPAALVVGEQTVVGRITAGAIAALSVTQLKALIGNAGAAVDGLMVAADYNKLAAIEASADVTDAANVDAAGAVMEGDYGANSILAATTIDVPVSLEVGVQTLVGRITAGNIAALSVAQVKTLIGDSGTGVTGLMTGTQYDKLAGIEAAADVTDATNVLAALAAATASVAVNSQKITSMADPTAAQDAATKAYVDSVAQGLNPIGDCVAITTEALPACTYANGTLGVGATLTANAVGVLPAQDGVTLVLSDRLLVKNQAATLQNGVYQLSTVGTAGVAFILTRVTDMDIAAEISHVFTFITGGTTGADTGWVCTNEPEAVVVGTDPITFSQFSAAGHITAGTGLTKTGNTISMLAIDGGSASSF